MIFSTADDIPLSVYGESLPSPHPPSFSPLSPPSLTPSLPPSLTDQWTVDYVLFLMDTVEAPPEEDEEEQVADAFLNVILSYNQHFKGEGGREGGREAGQEYCQTVAVLSAVFGYLYMMETL